MLNIFGVMLYVLFYGGAGFTVFLFGFAVFGAVKLLRKNSTYKKSKKTFAVFTLMAAVVSVGIIGVFSAFVIRFYALPVACVQDAGRQTLRMNESSYQLSDAPYPFDARLRPVARENISAAVFTPEWALQLALPASCYYTDGEDTGFIYYPGMMEWLVYETTP
jgi:hypothetical protein